MIKKQMFIEKTMILINILLNLMLCARFRNKLSLLNTDRLEYDEFKNYIFLK